MVVEGSRRTAISLGVAVLLAAALLYYSLRGIEWRQVAAIVARARLSLLSLCAAMATLTLFLRAVRWRVLLNAEGSVPISAAFWATAAGMFGNNFLPARAGELVRTFMISAGTGLGGAFVLATALSERVVDAIVLVMVSALVLLTLDAPPGWLAHAARPFAAAGLVGVAVILILPLLGSLGHAAIARAPVPHALRRRLAGTVEGVLRGFRAFHDARRLAGFLALTSLIWLLDATGAVVGGAALGLRIHMAVAFLLMAGLGVASALPSTPGYVGIYQFVAVSMLTPFGFSRTDAIAYILVAQALAYIVIGVWGSVGLARYRRARRSM